MTAGLFMPLDEAAVTKAAEEMKAAGLKSVGISAIFSPLDPSHERRAAELVRQGDSRRRHHLLVATSAASACSSARMPALLNAALADLARDTIAAFEKAIARFRHRRTAVHHPERRHRRRGEPGAAPAGLQLRLGRHQLDARRGLSCRACSDAMVIDVGGTTTDVGQLKNGFPREANSVVKVGGVRTLFRMPDLLSIGLGGGSHVQLDPLKVGPVSVGYRLLKEGIAFGGRQLTTTDIAVAAGVLELGDRKKVAHLDAATCKKVFAEAARMAEEAIDRMKTEAGDVPLIAVGGGAFLIPEKLPGVSRVIHVEHGDCANAVGAAIAQVSGECDQIFKDLSRAEALSAAQGIANDRAVAAGAARASLATIESEDMPLAYLPGNSVRVRVRVVGDVAAALNPEPRFHQYNVIVVALSLRVAAGMIRRDQQEAPIMKITLLTAAALLRAHARPRSPRARASPPTSSRRAKCRPIDSKASGMLTATYDTASKKLTYSATYKDLTRSRDHGAHFHGPADAKTNAGVVVPVKDMTPTRSKGEATLTDAQAADLEAGKWYFNIHTADEQGRRDPRPGHEEVTRGFSGLRSRADRGSSSRRGAS